MNVLYVNHTAVVSGGERSLLALLEALPAEVDPLVATPRGPLLDAVSRLGIPTAVIHGTAGSLRLHPLHTPRALADMELAALGVARIARRRRADLLHANSIRAGIALALGSGHGAARLVHVRDCLPPGIATTATMRLIAARADTIVANSQYTARSVRASVPDARVQVVHNPVDLRRWDPDRIDRAKARARLGVAGTRRVLLGVLAQISPWKGQHTAVQALAILRERGLDAHLLLIGSAKFVARSTRFDNEAYLARLHGLIAAADLGDRVSWLGERDDAPELVRAMDILLLPSEEEPFGRALIEAMALGVPVLATNVGGPPEIVQDGREGYLLPPGDPAAWAGAIERIAETPELGAELGRAGRIRVEREFSARHHVDAMLDVYRRVIA